MDRGGASFPRTAPEARRQRCRVVADAPGVLGSSRAVRQASAACLLLLLLVVSAFLPDGRAGSAQHARHDAEHGARGDALVVVSRDLAWGRTVLATRVPRELLPPQLLAGADIAPAVPDASFEREYAASSAKGDGSPNVASTIGFFTTRAGAAPRLRVRASLTARRAEGVLIHEWGHVVWLHLITPGESQKWVRLWSRARGRGTLPSPYSLFQAKRGGGFLRGVPCLAWPGPVGVRRPPASRRPARLYGGHTTQARAGARVQDFGRAPKTIVLGNRANEPFLLVRAGASSIL